MRYKQLYFISSEDVKWIVHPQMNILSSFTLSSCPQRYFSGPYNESVGSIVLLDQNN